MCSCFLVYPWEEGKLEVSFSDILHKTLIVLILNTYMYDVTCFLSLKTKPIFKKIKNLLFNEDISDKIQK